MSNAIPPAITSPTRRQIAYLAMLSACPPLSIDMYLPAMPTIAENWNIPTTLVSISLTLWFVGFSISLLICGPLSDQQGRKPVLLGGLLLFTISTLACGVCNNIYQLITFRVLQGMGAGAPSAMCLAICRDRYTSDTRKKVLAMVSVLLTLGPMLSPSIGTVILHYFDWHAIFIAQGLFGAILLITSIPFKESNESLLNTSLIKLMGRYIKLIQNKKYLHSTLTLGALIGPYLGFVAIAPLVYIQIYDLSKEIFSILFAANAMMYMLGAYFSTPVAKKMGDINLLSICMIAMIVGGMGIILFGTMGPWAFAACMGLISASFGMTRPISQHIVLDQVQTDVGSASSMLIFYQFIVGATCMSAPSIPQPSPIVGFGVMTCCIGCIVLLFWYRIHHNLIFENQTN